LATKEQIKTELIEDFNYKVEDLEDVKYQDLKKKLKTEHDKVKGEDVSDKEPEKPKRKVQRDDIVSIMNTTTGKVLYKSKKTGAEWVLTEYGDTDQIEVSELITMKNAHPRYLKEPWLMILDDDVVNYLGLSKLYKNVLDPDELDELFKISNKKFEKILKDAPRGMKQLIVGTAKQKLENGTFDSIKKKELIEETFGIELSE